MPQSRKVLEDSIRLARIRRIKLMLYVVQLVMLVAFAVFFIIIMGGAQIKPVLYVPLDSFTAVMVLLLLVICLESFFFRIMEIRFARSSSARHLMAKNSMRTAIAIAVVAAFAMIMLMVPSVQDAVREASSETLALTRNSDLEFWTRDHLALQQVSRIEVSAPERVEVYVVDDATYNQFESSLTSLYLLRLNRNDYVVNGDLSIDVPVGDFEVYHLVLNDLENPGTVATVVILKDLSETLTGVVALLCAAFVASNIAWVAYLIPIERKYSAGSIYK